MSQAKPQSDGLLDTFINGITNDPKNMAIFTILLGSSIFSLASVLIGFVAFLIARCFSITIIWMLALAVLLIVGSWWIDGVSAPIVHAQNKYFFTMLIHGHLMSSCYLWLSAMPYGLLFGGLLACIVKLQWGLQGDMKRVSQGKMHIEKTLHPKRLQRILKKLPHSAYNTGTILGVNRKTGQYAVLGDTDANLHTLAIGTTGSGKTTSLGNIVESVILRELPLFFIDGKGDLELAHRIKQFAASHQRPFYLFSMIGDSFKYNPISMGGITSKKDRIVELRTWSEDHYRKLAEGYLQTAFKIFAQIPAPMDLNVLGKHIAPKALCEYARTFDLAEEVFVQQVESLESKFKDIQSLVAEIENLVNSEIGHLFDCSSGDVITLDRVLQEQGIVYFCLQPLAFPAYAELLGKLIINDLKSLVAAQLQKPKKTKLYMIFDDFSVFAGDQIMNLMNQGRGAGVHAIVSTQSLSDLLRKGGEALLGQLLNNINNYIIQRQNNPADAEILSNIIGTKDDFQITSQISDEQGGARAGSVRRVKEFIIHPDQIKRLGLGEAILVNKQRFSVQQIMLRKGSV